ncbi:MAG: helicase-related protein, partial [Pseudomonadales bacterium]
RDLAGSLMQNPQRIDVTPPNSTAAKVKQWLIPVDKKQKPALLIQLIKNHNWPQILVFSRTKHGANKLVRLLDAAKISALAIHGNKSQSARMNALAKFKDKQVQVLVATDIAARGLDISQLPIVINLDLPNVAEDYVHRIGRTGRAEQSGQALSLVSADEVDNLYAIERLIQKHIEREYESGFEPVHELPLSKPILPPKRKRPKKPKKANNTASNYNSSDTKAQHPKKSKLQSPKVRSNKNTNSKTAGPNKQSNSTGKPATKGNRKRPAFKKSK